MRTSYTYTELCQKTPADIGRIKEELKNEYAELLQEHHSNCASILFYQVEINNMHPPVTFVANVTT